MKRDTMQQVSEEAAQRLDAALLLALNRLGIGSVQEAVESGRLVRGQRGDGTTEFQVDDRPIVRFKPPQAPTLSREGHATTYHMNFELSVLVNERGEFIEDL